MEKFLRVNIVGDSSKLQKSLKGASSSLKTFGSKLTSIGKDLSLKVTAPLALAGGAAVKSAADFERLRTTLNVLTGSAEKGSKAFERLVKFSAKTPFQLEELVKANNTLMGFGVSAEDAYSHLQAIGDIAAVSGGDLQGISVAFGQVAASGRLMGQDLLQLINNGVPVIDMLSDSMGVAKSEIKDLVSEGKVTFPVLIESFRKATTAGGKFEGGMQKLSETFAGQFSTLKDNLNIALAQFGEILLPVLNKAMASLTRFLGVLKNLNPETKTFIAIISSLTAALPLLVYALGTLSTALAAINPVTIAVTASIAALGGVITKTTKLKSVTTRINEAKGKIKELGAEIQKIEKSKPFLDGNIDSLKEYHQKQKELNESIVAFYEAQIEGSPNAKKATEQFGGKIEQAKNKILIAESALKSLNTQITNMAKTSGDLNLDDFVFTTPELVEDEPKLARSLESLFNTKEVLSDLNTEIEKFDPDSVNVADIFAMDDEDDALSFFEKTKKELKEAKEQFDKLAAQVHNQISPAFDELGSAIKSNLKLGDNAIGRFAGMMIDMAMSVVSSALAASTAAAIQGAATGSLLAGPAAPFVIGGLIAAAVGTVASAFSSDVPALANGGIVSAPTLAMVGDNLGANRGNPEVISPLNKLQGMMAGSRDVNVGGEFRIQGQDLVVALQRAERHRSRIL